MMEHYDTGFTLSYQIRKDDRFKNVPLVMLSGVASQTGRRFDKQTDELKKWSKLDAFVDKRSPANNSSRSWKRSWAWRLRLPSSLWREKWGSKKQPLVWAITPWA